MSNVTNTDYLFLSAYIRAREPKLLTRERLDRMVDAPDFDEAAKVLVDCGYPELSGASDRTLEEAFLARRSEFLAELDRFCPEKELVDAFRLKYDYHNAKTLVKAEAAGVEGSSILSGCGRVAPAVLREAFVEDSWRKVPRPLSEAIRKAKVTLARTGDPQLSDMELDRAYFAELLALTGEISSELYAGYVRLSIDVANLRSAVRCIRGRMEERVLRAALIEGGNIAPGRIARRVYTEGVAAVFSDRALRRAAELGQLAIEGDPLAAFERECDNALGRFMAEAKYTPFGADVAAAYLAGLEGEIVAARMVLLGKRSGLGPEKLRERLRECYV